MSDLRTPYVNPKRTICEVLRDIYHIIKDFDMPEIVELLNEAYTMGKKMDAKLRQYKGGYDDGWYEKTKDIELKESIRVS
jgi:hypothetical protein